MADRAAGQSPAVPVRVLRVDSGRTELVLFLGPLQGHLEHRAHGRNHPCMGPEECDRTLHRGKVFFYAYASGAVFVGNTGKAEPVVIQATANLEEQLRGMALRGQIWALSREPGKGRTGRLVGEFVEQRPQETLPKAFCVEGPLLRLFNVERIKLGVNNPAPNRLVLPALELEPVQLGRLDGPVDQPLPMTDEQRRRLSEQFRRQIRTYQGKATNGSAQHQHERGN